MYKHILNSSTGTAAETDRWLSIDSMDGDATKFAYYLDIIKETSRSIYAESDTYGWVYRIDKKTTTVYLDNKKIADRCTYTTSDPDDEDDINSSRRRLNSATISDTAKVKSEVEAYVRNYVYDVFDNMIAIDELADGCNFDIVAAEVPGYDPEWAALEYTAEDDENRARVMDACVDYIMNELFRKVNVNSARRSRRSRY